MRVLVAALGLAGGALAGIVAYLRLLVGRRDPAAQAELARALRDVDRELAADLEVLAMFGQTKQAFVLENGQFLAHRALLEREVPEVHATIAGLYERMPVAESAMERRGPAGSIRDADRELVQEWEGDAREAQRLLRASVTSASTPRWDRLIQRMRGR